MNTPSNVVDFPQVTVRDMQVGGADGLLAARLYMNAAVREVVGTSAMKSVKQDTLIVFFHGGGFVGGYLVQSLGVQPVTLASAFARGRGLWGKPLVDALDDYVHLAGIGINGECLPSDGNRLVLSDETDSFGIPKARITYGYGANEQAIDAHARSALSAIWTAAGARDLFAIPRSAHTIGTCRMGRVGDDAVVDPDGRSFDIGNLWISDNSIFPSSLAANPALTTMAMALRTADRFLAA